MDQTLFSFNWGVNSMLEEYHTVTKRPSGSSINFQKYINLMIEFYVSNFMLAVDIVTMEYGTSKNLMR